MKVTGIMENKTKRKTEKKEQKFSFILLVGLLFLVGYFAISFINVRMNINDRQKQVAQLKSQLEQQQADNARLQTVIDGGDQEEYIERIAREKLGYVMPGEKVYYNVTPQN